MKITLHSHNGGGSGKAKPVLDAVVDAFKDVNLSLGANTAPRLRQEILARLRTLGWSNEVRIRAKLKLTITATHGCMGLCLQTGNVSRLYADMLKLQATFLSDNIEQAFIVVPMRAAARRMGRNLASYERLVGELGVFRAIITLPVTVVGISD